MTSASRIATFVAAVVPVSALFASAAAAAETTGQSVSQASTSVMSVPGSPEKNPTPLPQPKGVPVRVTVGPPATLGDPLSVTRSPTAKPDINDRPGVRTAIIGAAAGGGPVVSASPGSAQVLGDAATTTVIDKVFEFAQKFHFCPVRQSS